MTAFRDLVDPITDEDIAWVCGLMELRDLDAPRTDFLRSVETLDVSACPGSGKTTLVVAKLAILARKWKSKTRGICVLSHTNVAREEIEHRLGGTDVGQRLLTYPHFIDTIHGFVNKFLATPWLLSAGYRVTAIDNDLTVRARRRFLGERNYRFLNGFLERHHGTFEALRITSTDFENPLVGATFPSGPQTPTYQFASTSMSYAAKQGYFCYDEIFVLGEALLDQQAGLPATLQQRFPCVLIDEMQDTSEMQNGFLRRIFPRDNLDICVMRVGDPNQAIFEGDSQVTADGFPDVTRSVGIASSFRFDSTIAALASPFAFLPVVPSGLQGIRRNEAVEGLPHTVFVFPDDNASQVLDAYGHLVLAHLPAHLIAKSPITAIGAVHKTYDLDELKAEQFPKTVSHYWASYEPGAHRAAHRPARLIEYFYAAQSQAKMGGTAQRGVENIAAGIIHLANLLSLSASLRARGRQHLQLEHMLADLPEAKAIYRGVVSRVLFDHEPLDSRQWAALVPSLKHLAVVLGGGDVLSASADQYLVWRDPVYQAPPAGELIRPALPNHYRYSHEGSSVDIKLSSIHVAKGQTHAATLVLETFNRTHFLNSLAPWLLGKYKNGPRCTSDAKTRRLMEMYVAMTRPTHLLCLAIRNSTLGTGAKYQANQDLLRAQGWEIQHL